MCSMQRFPADGPLAFVAMDLVGLMPKMEQGSQYIFVIINRYSKLTRAVPTLKTTATRVINVFMDHCIIPYGMPMYLLTDNGT